MVELEPDVSFGQLRGIGLSLTARSARCSYFGLPGVFSVRIPFGAALCAFWRSGLLVLVPWHTIFPGTSAPCGRQFRDVVGLTGRTVTVLDNARGAHIGLFRTGIAVALALVTHDFKNINACQN